MEFLSNELSYIFMIDLKLTEHDQNVIISQKYHDKVYGYR